MPENTPASLAIIGKYTAAIMARDSDTMQALRAENFVLDWVHADAFEDQPLTREQTDQFWPAWFQGFTQVDYEVTRTIAAETVVVIQWTFTGTHDGPLGPPLFEKPLDHTGKTIRLRGISVYDLETGGGIGGTMHRTPTDDHDPTDHRETTARISRETMYIDLATLYVELGVTL